MARTATTDVLDTFRFQLEVDGFVRAGFTECSAPALDIKVREYIEAGRHMNPLKITQSAMFTDVTLSRGSATDPDFLTWITNVFDLNNSGYIPTMNSKVRRTVKIFQYKRTGQLAKTFILYNCIPTAFKASSDFNAITDAISMESLKLAYEGFDIIAADGTTILSQTLNNILGSNALFS
jgi:phage tail-like protein